MSLEPNLAALVAASTKLTKSITMPLSEVNGKRDAATTAQADITAAETAIAAASATATTDAATTASKLSAAAADYATQKTTKGLAAVQTSADSELKDRLHRRDPARHPFRGARPSLVMDFVRRECHRNNAAGNLEPVDLSTFMTFTRGSTATYVGPDGLIKTAVVNKARYGYDPVTGEALGLLIEEQRTNLLAHSEGAINTSPSWLFPNSTGNIYTPGFLAPNGIANAVGYSFVGDGMNQSVAALTAGGTFTVSFYAKNTNTSAYTMQVRFGSGDTVGTLVNIPANTGWVRYSATYTVSSGGDGVMRLYRVGGSGVVIHLWGFQLEAGAFPTSYIPTPATFTGRASTKTYFDSNGVLQTAASGVAVTDYGYVDGRWVSKGLSLEPRATNLLIQSQDFTGYDVNGTIAPTISRGTVLSPTGVLSCADVTFAAGAGNSNGVYKNGIAGTLGTTYTASVFLKAGIGSVFRMSIEGSVLFGGNSIVDFDQATGNVSVQSTGGAPVTIRVTQFGAWYRISLTRTAVADGNMAVCFYSGIDGANRFVIYGAQLETGPVATSYIPTTTAQVTRDADTSTSAQVTRAEEDAYVAQITPWYNKEFSTFCAVAHRPIFTNSNSRVLTGDLSTSMEYLGIRPGDGIESYNNSGQVYAPAGWSSTNPVRMAISLSRSGRKIGANGTGLSLTNTDVTYMINLTKLRFWPYTISQSRAGYIRQLTYFPRQLSDADLQALTILED